MFTRIFVALLCVVGALAPSFAADPQPGAGAKRDAPVGVGDIAPDFTLDDQNGHRHTLSAERGKRPVVLVFYRGYW